MSDGSADPEETQPFTAPGPAVPPAVPYGPPATPPASYPPPAPPVGPPVPTHPQPTYPQPTYQQPTYQQPYPPGWQPSYGIPLPGSQSHSGATTSLVLGLIAVISIALTPFCCITLPGAFCGPFAWYVGAKATQEIDDAHGVYGNRGSARAGYVMGIVATLIGALVLAGGVAVAVLIGINDYSLV